MVDPDAVEKFRFRTFIYSAKIESAFIVPGIVVNGLLNFISFNAISRTVLALGISFEVPIVIVLFGSTSVGIIEEIVSE